jgi:hypothetical protein
MQNSIVIRHSTDSDEAAIRNLAALDSRPTPSGDALLAFAGTELRAALPVEGGAPIADPFHPTAEVVELLRLRADQMQPGNRYRLGLGRRTLRLRAA